MKIWPLSDIMHSDLMVPELACDVMSYLRGYTAPSVEMALAVIHIVQNTPHRVSRHLAVVINVGAPARRLYLDYPDTDEWLRLERATAVENPYTGGAWVHVDALH